MTRRRLRALLVSLAVLWPSLALAATLTVMPTPYQTALDGNGNPINGGKVCTYAAGTTTPIATYTDVTGATQNLNPIIADPAGRFTAWLLPGTSYKFVYQDASGTANTCDGVTFRTVDNVSAIPGASAGVDQIGTAGEALTAGQAVYLSDGSGGKQAGQWYKADSANTYSSTTPVVGMVPSSIASGGSGSIRLSGSVTGLSSLTVGGVYYVGTAGALTTTSPANSRTLGQADTTSTFIVDKIPSTPPTNNTTCQGRLTLTTAVPVTTADVLAATTLRFAPYAGNQCALYNGTNWILFTFPELSIAVPATTSQMYDVFLFDNAGTRTLELLAWTNDTTRATALVTQDGVLEKTGALTRRYVGSFRTTTVSGQTEDSFAKRYVWNYYNRMRRPMRVVEATDTWTYSTATWRQANAAAANQLDCVIGVAEVLLDIRVLAVGNNSSGGVTFYAGIGEDVTNAPAAGMINDTGPSITGGNTVRVMKQAWLQKYPAVGRHFYAWLEYSEATITTTWYGDNGGALSQSGIAGWIEG